MIFYKARLNEIVDQDGKQIAVVVPTICTKKAAREMAAYCAQQMNHAERNTTHDLREAAEKALEALQDLIGTVSQHGFAYGQADAAIASLQQALAAAKGGTE